MGRDERVEIARSTAARATRSCSRRRQRQRDVGVEGVADQRVTEVERPRRLRDDQIGLPQRAQAAATASESCPVTDVSRSKSNERPMTAAAADTSPVTSSSVPARTSTASASVSGTATTSTSIDPPARDVDCVAGGGQ